MKLAMMIKVRIMGFEASTKHGGVKSGLRVVTVEQINEGWSQD